MDAARDAARATDPAGVDGGDSLGLDIGGGDAEENTPPLGGDADDAAAAADAAAPASSSSAQPDAGSDASEPSLDALLDALAARESPSPLLRSPSSPARPPPPSPAVGAASTPLVGHGGRPDAAMPVTPPAKLLSEGYINSLPGHLRAAVLAHSKADSAGSPHPKSSSLVINIGRILEAEHDREGSDEMAARIAALKPHEVHESSDPTAAEALWFFSTGAEAEAFLAPSQATTTRMSKSRFNVDKFEPARPRKCGTCDAADAAVVAFCTKCEHYLCQACRVGKKHRVDKPKHLVCELFDEAAEQHLRPLPQQAFDKNDLCTWSRDAVAVRDGASVASIKTVIASIARQCCRSLPPKQIDRKSRAVVVNSLLLNESRTASTLSADKLAAAESRRQEQGPRDQFSHPRTQNQLPRDSKCGIHCRIRQVSVTLYHQQQVSADGNHLGHVVVKQLGLHHHSCFDAHMTQQTDSTVREWIALAPEWGVSFHEVCRHFASLDP